ncbi:MAG: diacylglycerol kinase [bacterium]
MRKSLKNSFKNAYRGLLQAIFKQSHMFYLMMIIVIVILLFLFLRISYIEWLILFVALSLPIIAELINTAFEVIVDHLSPHYNPSVRLAKDIAAGAVLVGLIIMTSVVALIFFHRLFRPVPTLAPSENKLVKLAGGLVILFILLGALKVWGNKGKEVRGIVGEESALAFYLAYSVNYLIENKLFFLGMLFLAFLILIVQLVNYKKWKESLLGAFLGLTLSIFLFSLI